MGDWTIDFDRIYRTLDLLYGWLRSGPSGMDRQLLSLAAALLTGLTVMTIASRIRLSLSQSPSRALADYMAYVEEGSAQRNNSLVDKEAVILLALGLPVRKGLLTLIRLGAGGIPALLLLLLGFPIVPAVAGGGLVYMLTNAFLHGQWHKLRVKLEQELPTFVSRLAGALLVTNAPLKAIAEVADTLSEESPLHAWLQRLLAGTRLEGRRFLEGARAEAALISPSLALVVFQLGRLLETGGAGFTRAFTTTAEELSAILEARAVAGAKAESARGAVFMMLGIMGVIMLLMLSSPNIRQGFQNPVVQVVAALALTVMALGYAFLNGMIDEALEG